MANTTPSTPENLSRRMAANRSFTLPPKLANPAKEAEIGASDGVETLYVHPRASVIKFTIYANGSSSRPSSSAGSPRGLQTSGTLPWATLTERTVAAGPLEIYRVPGSVSFLHSGTLLHAILPRSQCWCVDGVSKFAFRVLPDTYYRIELPGTTAEDLEKVEELKATFGKVLFYERTPCPFARTFSVELPDAPSERTSRMSRRISQGPAKKWRLDTAYSWKPEDGEQRRESVAWDDVESVENSGDEADAKVGDTQGRQMETDAKTKVQTEVETEVEKSEVEPAELGDSSPAEKVKNLEVRAHLRPKGMTTLRSITAPPQLTMRSTPPSRIRMPAAFDSKVAATPVATTSSARLGPERLRTFQTIPTDMPPSPPDSSAGMDMPDPLTVVDMEEEDEEDGEGGQDGENEVGGEQDGEDEVNIDEAEEEEDQEDETDVATPVTEADRMDSPVAEDHNEIATRVEAEPLAISASTDETTEQEAPIRDTVPVHRVITTTETQQPMISSSPADDPYAAIQARIRARRSIGGTTALPNPCISVRHASSSRVPSTATPAPPSRPESASRSVSTTRLPRQQQQKQNQTFIATALAKKAVRAVFVGPPAHLVAIMLRIAARFAKVGGLERALGFFVIASPPGAKQRVPGSFDLDDLDTEDEGDDGSEDSEDDFGVPLRSPVRLVNMSRQTSREVGSSSAL